MADTLAWRRGVRFVVYTDAEARGVTCYMSLEDEARMAGLWRKRVRVKGLLQRDSTRACPCPFGTAPTLRCLSRRPPSPRTFGPSCRLVLAGHPKRSSGKLGMLTNHAALVCLDASPLPAPNRR